MKSSLAKLLPQHGFVRSVAILVGGTVGAQALTILVAPVLTRLYDPTDFGLLATYTGLLTIWSVIASLRYELAIPLPQEERDAANLVLLSALLTVFNTLVSILFVGVFGNYLASLFATPVLASYLWLLPLGILLSSLYRVVNYWAVRQKEFGAIASTHIQQSTGKALIQLIGFKMGAFNLLLAQSLSQGIGVARLGRIFIRATPWSSLSFQALKSIAARYRRFPIYSTGEGFLNTVGLQMPPLLFASLFGPAAAGHYSLATQVLSLPMTFVGNAVGQVFFSRAAQAHRDGALSVLVINLHSRLSYIGFPPALLLIFVAPDLFSVVFGTEWRLAGDFVVWMVPWLYLVFVASPLSTLFAVVEKQVQGLAFQVILALARLSTVGLGAYLYQDVLTTVALFAIASAFCWLGFLFWLAAICGISVIAILQPTLKAAAGGALCVAPFFVARHLAGNPTYGWMVGLGAGALAVIAWQVYVLRKVH